MKYLALLILVSMLIISCSDNSSSHKERVNGYSQVPVSKEDSLFQKVMDGHDSAMAKMGRLGGLRKQALQTADSLSKTKSPANKERARSLHALADKLQASENNMNAWMEGFSVDSAKDDEPKRIAYLESERGKVTRVKNEMLTTLAEADSLLKK